MKSILLPACALLCVCCLSACDSIEEKWLMYKVDALLSQVDTAGNIKPGSEAIFGKMVENLSSGESLAPPISQDSSKLLLKNPLPPTVAGAQFQKVYITNPLSLDAENNELLPGLNSGALHPERYWEVLAWYQNPTTKKVVFPAMVEDQGGLAPWMRTARWIKQREGYVSKQAAKVGWEFSGTTEFAGRTWVIWKKKTGETAYKSWWGNRFEAMVSVDRPEAIGDFLNLKYLDSLE